MLMQNRKAHLKNNLYFFEWHYAVSAAMKRATERVRVRKNNVQITIMINHKFVQFINGAAHFDTFV